jgi:SsrA-binding protein
MKIEHKQVYHEYDLLEKLEAGISLTGPEVKSVVLGHVSLEGSFVKVIDGEIFLINCQIFPYQYARPEGYDPKRTRKLLMHKQQIMTLFGKTQGTNLTLVPVSLYNKGPKIKLEIALARGKKQYEKREKIRKEDQKRELERNFRGKVK